MDPEAHFCPVPVLPVLEASQTPAGILKAHPIGWRGALTPLQSSPAAAGSKATPPKDPAVAGPLSDEAWRKGSTKAKTTSPKTTSLKVGDEVRARLRRAIAEIERPALLADGGDDAVRPWRLGCPEADRRLPGGLSTLGVHEVKAEQGQQGASAADWMTAIGFALRLAVRRLEALDQGAGQSAGAAFSSSSRSSAQPSPWLMWCWPQNMARELGAPSALGLRQLGLPPERLLIVETGREAEALIALEDGLRSKSLALVFGVFDSVALTPSRRLSLAAEECRTPCLVITHPGRAAAPSSATRWRVGRKPRSPHPLIARVPGEDRFCAILERCRARPESSTQAPLHLEWSDETHRFSVLADVADKPAAPRRAVSRSG